MKKFTFRLQRVTDVREKREKECQRELGVSQDELRREELRLQELSEDSKRNHEGLRSALERRSNAGRLVALDSWRMRRVKELENQKERAQNQQFEVEKKRKALVQASKAKKILERLKEKRKAEHRKKVQRAEQIFLDEIGHKGPESSKGIKPHRVEAEEEVI